MFPEKLSGKSKEWTDRFLRFESSDQTVVEFCRREGVSQPSFYQWRRKLGVSERPAARRRSTDNRVVPRKSHGHFRPVAVSADPFPKVRFPSGIELVLGREPELVQVIVKQLIESSVSSPGRP